MIYLSVEQVRELHKEVMQQSGGLHGVRDGGALESAVAQPQMMFGGQQLYPSLIEKAAAIGYSLIMNHPFIDGNKRIGHAAMAMFLRINGVRLHAPVDEGERMILTVAAGTSSREELTNWLEKNTTDLI